MESVRVVQSIPTNPITSYMILLVSGGGGGVSNDMDTKLSGEVSKVEMNSSNESLLANSLLLMRLRAVLRTDSGLIILSPNSGETDSFQWWWGSTAPQLQCSSLPSDPIPPSGLARPLAGWLSTCKVCKVGW